MSKFFDKRVPDEETILTPEEIVRAQLNVREKRQTPETSTQKVDDSAMYNKSLFEGDIMNPGLSSKNLKSFLEEDVQAASMAAHSPGLMRNAVRQSYLKWVNGRIPYTISKQYTSYGRDKIADAIAEYSKRTCIKFTPKEATDTDYVHILPDDGCYSLVGKVGGRQPVSLGDGCIQKGIIIHELMHSVGFFHEQSRADRDQYVTIKWTNVEAGLEDQFDKYSLNMIDHLGTLYDYASVMHYASTAFSKNGQPTIVPIQVGVEIGQRTGFSATDLYKINKLYSCSNVDLSVPPTNTNQASVVPSSSSSTSTSVVITSPQTLPTSPNVVSPGTVVVPVPSTPNNNCADARPDCPFLASKGHCESVFSSVFMTLNCAKSCGKCSETSGPSTTGGCEDLRSWCSRWASSGMCELYIFQEYMHSKCALSCKICT